MKDDSGVRFVSTTVIGGLLFLVPVVLLILILGKALGFMMIIAEPMANWIPIDTIGGVALANLIALAAVILLSFLAGLVARNAMASNFVRHIESKFLMKIPGYTLIKGFKGHMEEGDTLKLKPVALALGTAERFGFEVQKLPDDRSMVFIPSVPNASSGITQLLPAEQVTYLDVSIGQFVELIERYGLGVDEILDKKVTDRPAEHGPATSDDEDEEADE